MSNYKRHLPWIAVACALWTSLAAPTMAQNYAIDWHTITAGGGSSSTATYNINGSIRQASAAHSEGGRTDALRASSSVYLFGATFRISRSACSQSETAWPS